jgi:Ras-related protein Rab-11A
MYVSNCLSSYKTKILILGSTNSGKHSLCRKYGRGFNQNFDRSIGIDIYVQDFTRPDGESITYACWICSPYKRFEYYWPRFFRGAMGALILFDITDRKSYEEAKEFVEKIHKNVNYIPIVLLGNKIDLESNRKVSYDEAFDFTNKERLTAYKEVSIKQDLNVLDSLEILNEAIYFYCTSEKSQSDPSEVQII